MKKVLIGCVIVAVAVSFISLMLIDDTLNPNIKSFINEQQSKKKSSLYERNKEAYYYLLGFSVNELDDPVIEGKKLLQSIETAYESSLSSPDIFNYDEYPEERKLSPPQGEIFCEGCDFFKSALLDSHTIRVILEKHSLLRYRFKKLLAYDQIQTLTTSSYSEPLPDYSYILVANKLVILESFYQASLSNPIKAKEILLNHLSNLRIHIESTDRLISKLLYLMMISEVIDGISILNHHYNYVFDSPINILSKKERSLNTVLMHELLGANLLHQSLDRNPEILDNDGDLPGWYVRLIYKPNITTNALYFVYKEYIRRSTLSQIEFSLLKSQQKKVESPGFNLRNIVGSILGQIELPVYDEYIARFFDVNNKIILLNDGIESNHQHINSSETSNAQSELLYEAFLSNDETKVCNDGLTNKSNLKCLRLKP